MADERVVRWRMILGKQAEADLRAMAGISGDILDAEGMAVDEALEVVYPSGGGDGESGGDITKDEWKKKKVGPHGAHTGKSVPRLARWLGEIRDLFPKDVVAMVQKDAIERRGLKELLFEPEMLASVEPSLDLAATILSLKNLVPDKAKAAARDVVRKAVEELRKKLESEMYQAVRGSINRGKHSPMRSLPNMDWHRTIRRNLKNYDAKRKTVIPQEMSFFSRTLKRNEWNVTIAMDQSGSMASSLIYGGVMGAILASMPAVETHVVAFNHNEVVDMTELCQDPVDLLFGIQLGGAEDYWMATNYCERFFHTPAKTLYILLADLYDTSPNEAKFVKKMEQVVSTGVKAIALLAISDQGQPSYNQNLAKKLADLGMPCIGCTPNKLPDLLAAVLRGQDLAKFGREAMKPEKTK